MSKQTSNSPIGGHFGAKVVGDARGIASYHFQQEHIDESETQAIEVLK
jgi:hypothetical protein